MQYILGGKIGTAPVLYTQTPSISEEAAAHPQIDYPDNFDANTLFSYYYYDDGSYYTDIYYEGKLRDRIPLGKELPKRVKISANNASWYIIHVDQHPNVVPRSIVEGFMDSGLFNLFKGSAPFSSNSVVSDILELVLPVNNYEIGDDTILVNAQIWRPTTMGNDVKYEQLLIQP